MSNEDAQEKLLLVPKTFIMIFITIPATGYFICDTGHQVWRKCCPAQCCLDCWNLKLIAMNFNPFVNPMSHENYLKDNAAVCNMESWKHKSNFSKKTSCDSFDCQFVCLLFLCWLIITICSSVFCFFFNLTDESFSHRKIVFPNDVNSFIDWMIKASFIMLLSGNCIRKPMSQKVSCISSWWYSLG